MKKAGRILLGLIAGAAFAALFGWLSWYVVDEGSVVGYIAAGLFGIMAVFGAALGFIWFAVEGEPDQPVVLPRRGKGAKDKVDPVLMGVAMLNATSDNFMDTDDVADTDFGSDDGGGFVD
ncbi:MAG: hypothetical protein HN403_08345 [Rhodospirillales bacterium]|jgi:hypothetical protein|nr:hypothetical protein [Rhodospirillales bacterium]